MKTIITQKEIRELAKDIDIDEDFAYNLEFFMQDGLEEACNGCVGELFPLSDKKLTEIMDSITVDNYTDISWDIMRQAMQIGKKIGYIHGIIKGANAHVEEFWESKEYIDFLCEQGCIV